MGVNARGSAPITSSLDGKLAWLQGNNELKTSTTAIAVTPSAEGGSPGDLQLAIDALSELGGTVYLRNGTYLLDADVVIPSYVTILGESHEGVIIDFEGGEFQVKAVGANAYTTGTVAVNNASTTVTGTGTTWDTGMIGQSIILSGAWFVITNVASTTSLTIEAPFDFPSITGQNYVIADPVTGHAINNVIIQNSAATTGGLLFQYSSGGDLEGVSVYDSEIGFNFLDCGYVLCEDIVAIGCTTGVNVNHGGVWTFVDFAAYECTTNMALNRMFSASIANATISSATGNGITITNSQNLGIYDMTVTTNGGKGIEISDSNNMQIFGMNVLNNVSDGIKLTSNADRIAMHNIMCNTNGAYGINIANANCDKNTINSCFFNGNTSGTVNNLGTSTISVNNQT